MGEALPAVRTVEQEAAQGGGDAPAHLGQRRPRRRPALPARAAVFSLEPQVLQEGERELAQKRVVVQPDRVCREELAMRQAAEMMRLAAAALVLAHALLAAGEPLAGIACVVAATRSTSAASQSASSGWPRPS